MRGIGRGQTIRLYLIPEVLNRIEQELAPIGQFSGRAQLDVPAWLLVNSMRAESLQSVQMSLQELQNTWRKHALATLTNDCDGGGGGGGGGGGAERAATTAEEYDPAQRLNRFRTPAAVTAASTVAAAAAGAAAAGAVPVEGTPAWLRRCVGLFREPISYSVPACVPVERPFGEKVRQLVEANQAFADRHEGAAERVRVVQQRLAQAGAPQGGDGEQERSLAGEVVHENEQEQEAEEEAEEEEQKMSAFSRDDEQHNPWAVALLAGAPSGSTGGARDEAFYRFARFQTRQTQAALPFPPQLLLSDNFFRPKWCGLGDRRLKTATLVLEWVPAAGAVGNAVAQAAFKALFGALVRGGDGFGPPREAAAAAAEALLVLNGPAP